VVRADPGFELAAAPSLALVCLRVRTGRGAEADDAATQRRHVTALWQLLRRAAADVRQQPAGDVPSY
jgi:hypothetical protein